MTLMIKIEEKFKILERPNQVIRIDPDHPLDFFVMYNEYRNRTLVLKTKYPLYSIKSTKAIKITIQEDDPNLLFISLTDITLEEIFFIFCEDVLYKTNLDLPENQLIKTLYKRIHLWKLTFANPKSKLLSESIIRGLIGEIYFLSNYMINTYGLEKSVDAWVGPKKTKRDFEVDDTWYEVKTKSSASHFVKVTSITQLDLPIDGKLAVVSIEPTELKKEQTYDLNEIIDTLFGKIDDHEIDEKLLARLEKIGYKYDKQYEEHRYLIYDLNLYLIDPATPILRIRELPASISDVSYKLDLNFLKKVDE